jgi:hypothetical protein
MKYYIVLKMNELQLHAKTQDSLKNIMLIKINQTLKNTYCFNLYKDQNQTKLLLETIIRKTIIRNWDNS